MRAAVAATHEGFEAMVAALPEAAAEGRGERWLEGVFALTARHRGNGVGYDSICAAGDHANTLHWIKNTGDVTEGDLVLIDAGVEVDTPLHGRHHPHPPRRRHLHRRPARGLRRRLRGAGGRDRARCSRATGSATSTPPPSASSPSTSTRGACSRRASRSRTPSTRSTASTTAGGWSTARRTTSASTSTTAPSPPARSTWTPSSRPGMVLTVEPGLYFKADDLKAPERFRGIGVRIEDDVARHRGRLREPLRRDAPQRRRGRGLDRAAPGPLSDRAQRRSRTTSRPRARSTPAASPAPPRIVVSSSRGTGKSSGSAAL